MEIHNKNVARPSGTTMQLAVNSRKFHRCPSSALGVVGQVLRCDQASGVPSDDDDESEESHVPSDDDDETEESHVPSDDDDESEESHVPSDDDDETEDSHVPSDDDDETEESHVPSDDDDETEESHVPSDDDDESEESHVPSDDDDESEESHVPSDDDDESEESHVPSDDNGCHEIDITDHACRRRTSSCTHHHGRGHCLSHKFHRSGSRGVTCNPCKQRGESPCTLCLMKI